MPFSPWEVRLLSFSHDLSSIPIYFLSLFRILVAMAQNIEKLMRDSLWLGLGTLEEITLLVRRFVVNQKWKVGLGLGNSVQ